MKYTIKEILKYYFDTKFIIKISVKDDIKYLLKNINDCNYIDYSSEDNSKFSYYTFDRFIRDIREIYFEYEYLYDSDPNEVLDLNKEINCERTLDYCYIRVEVNMSPKLRYHISPYKIVTRITESDNQKEVLNAFLALVKYNFKIVKGKDIKHWYHEENYFQDSGDLGSSCMRHDSCQDYFKIYTENDNVSLGVLTEGGKLLARCIIWDSKYIDRCYGIDTNYETILKNKCLEQLKDNNPKVIYEGKSDFRGDTKIYLKNIDFEKYPFLDSVMFVNLDDKYIHNDKDDIIDRSLGHTDGEYGKCSSCYHYQNISDSEDDDEESFECDACGYESSDEDSFVRCEESGNRLCSDCRYYCERTNEYYARRYVFQCSITDDWYHNDFKVTLANGEYAYSGEASRSDVDDEYYNNDDLDVYELPNGKKIYCTEDQYDEELEEYERLLELEEV